MKQLLAKNILSDIVLSIHTIHRHFNYIAWLTFDLLFSGSGETAKILFVITLIFLRNMKLGKVAQLCTDAKKR